MTQKLAPDEALERLFEVIRQEAASNPTFARRMLDAAGVTVVFEGSAAAKVADPIVAAARMDFAGFQESFSTLADKDLKAIAKGFGLATDQQLKAVKTKPKSVGFIELLWEGAKRKLSERS